MKLNDRVRNYAKQIGVDAKGQFSGGRPTAALLAKLTPAQRRRIRRKGQ